MCLSVWHPLVVAKGTRPTGKVMLGTIRRPDGRMQVTFKGAPLYTFTQDTKAGQTNGEGFKDVGVWRATTVGAAAAAPQSKPSPGYSY
jgi:predicted lipoprotein with Yx(FWY)xxD motif